jgi:hypothetical protein
MATRLSATAMWILAELLSVTYLVGSYGLLSPTAGLIMRRLFVIVAGCLASVGPAAAGDRETEGSSAALVLHRQ